MDLTPRRLFTAILFIALFVMATREIADPDFWWHLRTGQYILETGSIPRTDIFSFTRAGMPWVAHEWLSELLIYALYRVGSFSALILVFSSIISLAFALAWSRSEGRPYIASFALLLAALATAPTWGVRPQMFTFLFTSVYLLLLEKYRRTGRVRFLLPLPPLMLLWVNLHSGYALGLALTALFLIGLTVDKQFAAQATTGNSGTRPVPGPAGRSPSVQFRPLFGVLVALAVVVPINPNGLTMFVYPFETLTSRAMQTFIQEWFSPDFHLAEYQPFAWLVLALLAALALSPKRSSATDVLLLVFFGYAALRSARNIPIFALAAAPVLSEQLWALVEVRGWSLSFGPSGPTPRNIKVMNCVLLALIGSSAAWRINAVLSNQSAVVRDRYPVAAVDYLQSREPAERVYNSYNWGGYLIWRWGPNMRVYIDGRADVYGDPFIEEFLETYRAGPRWQVPLDKYGVQFVLVEPNAPLAVELARSGSWKRVYSDALAVIYEKCKADCADAIGFVRVCQPGVGL
jgi:hypothetical protein